jgi:hypothetical protein
VICLNILKRFFCVNNYCVNNTKKTFELGSLDEEFMTRLKGEPFFLKNPEAIFSGEDTGAILEENYTSVPELVDYYKKENLDASNVNVRDWLLAEAVPGNSWACGVANNDAVMKEFNFDMSAVKNAGSSENYFMTYGKKLDWPRKSEMDGKMSNLWWHSDYKNMSYNNVYRFYDKLKLLCSEEKL